jgi:sugar lactone lactonase YvrE
MKKLRKYLVQIVFFISVDTSLAQTIYTYAGTGNFGDSGDDGPALSAEFAASTGIASDASGNLYFCDWYFGRIRKIDTSGIITTIAGGGTDLNDGVLATSALVRHPWGMITDAAGNIYFAEQQYNQVRKINSSGIITTVAGIPNMSGNFSGDGGLATAASLNGPSDVAVDAVGNIYIADGNNHRIRVVNASGIITTISGSTMGFAGDGGLAINAKFNYPLGIAIDMNNNLYIGDAQNHRIRKIDNSGLISTIVGTGTQANSGDGGPAILAAIGSSRGLEVDGMGNIYFADRYYGTIRKIDTSGIITKIVGTGVTGYSGDGGPATLAQIQPIDVTIDHSGNFYITDDTRIRIVCNGLCINSLNELKENIQLVVYPNPATNVIHIPNERGELKNAMVEVTTNLGQTIINQSYSNTVDVTHLPTGIYTLKIYSDKRSYYSKFIKE